MAVQLEVQTEDTFSAFVAANDGIILFHKKLCPHCAVMNTVLSKVQPQMEGVRFASVDSEDQACVMTEAGVERVPTLVAVKGGEIRARFTGIMKPAEVMSWFMQA